MKQIIELHGKGESIRAITRLLDVSRNTVRRYLREPGIPKPKPRAKRGSKLDPYKDYIQKRLSEGVDNCVVLLREIRELGYTGGYSILKEYVHPFRRWRRKPEVTVRFETKPGEQAQVDFGRYRYLTPDGTPRYVWAFVLVLAWARAMYVEFIQRADVAGFIRCHINGFARLGGIPRKCLYDNAKLVVLDRDEAGQPIWNKRFLDFALRLGFDIQLCRPYWARTKGKVERGVGYVEGNFWPGARFTDLTDLNRRAQVWC
ncbi:IS21 family transposase [Desulforudis sp. Tu-874]|uniref:IS21 family transposase n=1 Tax=Desulforudis sp. Tu-874 TaxID=3416276 RepID=UPI003CE455C7